MEIFTRKILKEINKSKVFITLLVTFLIFYILAFRKWLFSLDILTSGDWGFYFNSTASTLRINYFSLWLSDSSFGRVLIDVPQAPTYFLYGIFAKYFSFSYGFNERIIHFLPAILTNPIGTYLLLNKLFPNNNIGNICGVAVYSLNTYFLSLYSGDVTLGTAFAFLPLLLYLFTKYNDNPNSKNLFLFLITCSIVIAYEPRSFYIQSIAIAIYFIVHVFMKLNSTSISKIIFTLRRLIPIILILSLINLYWLLGLVKTSSLVNNGLFSRGLFGSQYWNILYSFTLHQPWWSGSSITTFTNQPIAFYFWIIPVFAFLSFLLNKKNSIVLSFTVIALVGILLSKQADYPFTTLYLWLYNNFPGFGAFREASKFYALIAIGYSVLISALIDTVYKKLKSSIFENVIKIVLVTLIFVPSLLNTLPLITSSIGTLFVTRYIPSDYLILNTFLSNQHEYFRTLWIPTGSRWSPYTDLHSKLNDVDIIGSSWLPFNQSTTINTQSEQIINLFKESFSQDLLNISSIKYIIVPLEDSQNDNDFFKDYGGNTNPYIREFYITQLNSIPFLKEINIGTKSIKVFENQSFKDPIFSFTNLYDFGSLSNLNRKYNFTQNTLNGNFFFTLNNLNTSLPINRINNLFENINISNLRKSYLATTTSNINILNNNFIYSNDNDTELLVNTIDGNLNIIEEKTGLMKIGDTSLNTNAVSKMLTTVPIKSLNTFISYKDTLTQVSSSTVDIGLASSTEPIKILESSNNVIPNPSFEVGSWQKTVGDCNDYDKNRNLTMSVDSHLKTDGKLSLELSAASHIACVSNSFPVSPGDYIFSFDYQSPNAQNAGYYLSFNDPNNTVISSTIPIQGANWNTYRKEIIIPNGATNASLVIYAYSTDGKTFIINRYDNFDFAKLNVVADTLAENNTGFTKIPVDLTSNTSISYENEYYPLVNLIQNGSFDSGLWQVNVGDCNNYDDNSAIGMELDDSDKSNGSKYLQLSAKRHTACTSKSISVQGGSSYLLSFDYQSPNAGSLSYYIGFDGSATSSSYSKDIQIQDRKWHTYSSTIQVPEGASQISLVIYAKSLDGVTNIINRYDNFNLIKIPDFQDAYYLVSEPSTPPLQQPKSVTFDLINPTKKTVHITGATTGFFLAMSESWHPSWQLEMNNAKIHGFFSQWTPLAHPDKVPDDEHFELDDFLNGWYVDVHQLCEVQHVAGCTKNADGSYNLEMEIEFWPQRWFYVGLLISGTTLAGVLGTLGYIVIRDFRKKRNAKALITENEYEDAR